MFSKMPPSKMTTVYISKNMPSGTLQELVCEFENYKEQYPNIKMSDIEIFIEKENYDESNIAFSFSYEKENENYESELKTYEEEKLIYEQYESNYKKQNKLKEDGKVAKTEYKKQKQSAKLKGVFDKSG